MVLFLLQKMDFFLPPFIKVLPGFFLFCFCFVFFNLKYRLDVRFFGLLTFHSTNAGQVIIVFTALCLDTVGDEKMKGHFM